MWTLPPTGESAVEYLTAAVERQTGTLIDGTFLGWLGDET